MNSYEEAAICAKTLLTNEPNLMLQTTTENPLIKGGSGPRVNVINAARFKLGRGAAFLLALLLPLSLNAQDTTLNNNNLATLWRWAENPEYYLDEEKGVERSMKVLWPAYREAKGWKQVYDNVKRMNKKVRESGTMTEEEARKIIEEFRFKEPTKVERERLPKLGERPEKKKKAVDYRTAQEKTFAEKKARREKLLEISPKKKEEKKKFIPKITVPKTFKPKPPIVRPPYSK